MKNLYNMQMCRTAIRFMGEAITTDMKDDMPIVLATMNGSLVFAGHLLPQLNFPLELDYIEVSRYNGNTEGFELKWHRVPTFTLKDRNVLILDDIVDEGITLKAIARYCKAYGAKDVKSAVLVRKEGIESEFTPDYVGMVVPNEFVVGFGMDYKGLMRNMPGIYSLDSTDL